MNEANIGTGSGMRGTIAGLALMLGCLASAHASLIGDSVNARLFSPGGVIDISTPIDYSDSVVVGSGVEIAAGDGSNIGGIMLDKEFVNFGASSITVGLQAGGELGGIPVTGYAANARYIFSGLDFSGATITGLTFSVGNNQIANLAALGSNWITLADPHTVLLYLGDIQFVDVGGTSNSFANVTINLQTTVVPEPSTWLLLISGLAGLVLVRRGALPRRRGC